MESANRQSNEQGQGQGQAQESQHAAAQPAGATATVQGMLARGAAEPNAIAQVIRTHPGQRDAVITVLQQSVGNAFVQEVMAALAAPAVAPATGGGAEGGTAGQETEKLTGTLWAKGPGGVDLPPSLDDVSQGGLNDCYVFAALASMVSTDPARVQRMIKDNGNGTYTVTFKGIGWFSADEETVSADFVKGKHGNVGSRSALWPLLIELAYAKQRGGIAELDTGGNAGSAVDDFTNDGASRFDPRDEEKSYTFGRLSKAHDKKQPTTLVSPKAEDAGDVKKAMSDKIPGLHFWHFYAVVDIDAKGQRVKLFNPWGHDHPNGDGWVDMDVIKTFFIEVDINS